MMLKQEKTMNPRGDSSGPQRETAPKEGGPRQKHHDLDGVDGLFTSVGDVVFASSNCFEHERV